MASLGYRVFVVHHGSLPSWFLKVIKSIKTISLVEVVDGFQSAFPTTFNDRYYNLLYFPDMKADVEKTLHTMKGYGCALPWIGKLIDDPDRKVSAMEDEDFRALFKLEKSERLVAYCHLFRYDKDSLLPRSLDKLRELAKE
jgi:hypothetical protein